MLTDPLFSGIKQMAGDRRGLALIECVEFSKGIRRDLGAARCEKLLPRCPVEPRDLFVRIGLQGRSLEKPIEFVLACLP